MQYLTGFSKQKTKQQRFHISVQNKKAAFALVRLPQQGNKHSYNLLRSTAIDRSRPRVGEPGPRAMGTQQPGKESLLTKEHFLNVF